MGINIALSIIFLRLFTRIGWAPHGGLALANSTATALEMLVLLYLMRRRLNGLEGRRVMKGGLQSAFAATLMALGLFAWIFTSSARPDWLVLLGGVAIGGVIYSALILGAGVPEARGLLYYLVRKGKAFIS